MKYHYGSQGVRTDEARRDARSCSPRTRATSRRSTRSSSGRPARCRPGSTSRSCSHDPTAAMALLIHGDAAFAGQGIVAETLNLHGARRLLDRRHAPHRREQPDRLHDEPGGRALDALLERHRQGLRRADHPRERRRSRGRARRRSPGDGLPRRVPARRGRGRRRLPALRPQRGRRAGLHAAAHVRADREASDRSGALRQGSDRPRRRQRGRRRRRCSPRPTARSRSRTTRCGRRSPRARWAGGRSASPAAPAATCPRPRFRATGSRR